MAAKTKAKAQTKVQPAKVKTTSRLKDSKVVHHSRKFLERFFSDFLVLRSFLALTFFVLSFVFFYPLSNNQSEWLKLFVVLYGFILLLLVGGILYEYLIKITRLLITENVRIFTPIVTVNTFFGLIIPVFFGNILLMSITKVLNLFANYNTIICELRYDFINFYWRSGIYNNVNQLLMSAIVILFVFFLFGSLVERLKPFK